ncbi:MAG: LytS/YhcK type 5TM receptor domain-containing protein [Bacillota bacterium]
MNNQKILELLFTLFKSMSVIATFAYVLSRFNSIKHVLNNKFNKYEKIFLTIFFALLSIIGTFLGIVVMDAYANIRAIGALMAGLMGGPIVGAIAGLIAGLHRFSLGGFTSLACAIGTTSSGLIGGLFAKKYENERINFKTGFLIGLLALTIEMLIVIIFSRPLIQAIKLVEIIGLPMILTNSLGIAIFISILNKVKEDNQKIRAFQAEKVLSIAERSLPLLQNGLDPASAQKIIEMIKNESKVDAVSITDKEQVLAFTGTAADHHLAGEKIKTEASKKAIAEQKTIIIDDKKEINCQEASCQLTNAVITPLKIKNSIYGLLKLYRCQQKITVLDIKLAEGISNLLATQIKLAKLSKQAELKSEAELKALQAQINPHFLFNSLNATAALCRTKPLQARSLLIKLAGIFRRTLKRDIHQITLAEEIEFCQDYLSIEKARLGERLKVIWEIDPVLKNIKIPPFIIQPLIENSVKHGIHSQNEGGKIIIKVEKIAEELKITIADDGPGINAQKINEIKNNENDRIGINNIKERLFAIFGSQANFEIKSKIAKGTKNIITIPFNLVQKRSELKSNLKQ